MPLRVHARVVVNVVHLYVAGSCRYMTDSIISRGNVKKNMDQIYPSKRKFAIYALANALKPNRLL